MRHPSRPLLVLALLLVGCEGEFIDRGTGGNSNQPPATPPTLAVRLGGTAADLIVDMAVDPSGNIVVGGSFEGAPDFDPGSDITSLVSLGATDGFVAKYDATGNLLWAAQIGGTTAQRVTAVASDLSGNVYVSGGFTGSTDFDPSAAAQILTSLGGEDGFVAKLSPAGALLWVRRFGGLEPDVVAGVDVDAAGRVFAAGSFAGSANPTPGTGPTLLSEGGVDGFLLGFDATGAVSFGLRLGGLQADSANAVTVTSGGTVVVGGSFRGSATFGSGAVPNQLTAAGGGDGFLAGFAATGTLAWARALSGVGEEGVREGGLAADLSGGVVATGGFTGTTDFDGGTTSATRTSLGSNDWFVVRYDGNGTYQSAFAVGSFAADSVPRPGIDAAGAVVVTGGFTGAVDFDPSSGSRVLSSFAGGGATDAFVARYTTSGDFLWVSRFGEGTTQGERQNAGTAVAGAPLGGVLVAGRFFGSPDFDPGTPSFRLISLGASDGFLVMLTSAGALALTP